MKKLFSLLALTGAFALAPLSSADASHECNRRLVAYTPCGKPVYAYLEVVGRDRCGHIVQDWVTRYPGDCRCRSQQRDNDSCRSGSGHGHSRSHHRQSGWSHFRRF